MEKGVLSLDPAPVSISPSETDVEVQFAMPLRKYIGQNNEVS